ncbi:ABC transporter substrate-binding protein [Luteipulveratus halotolerans]|uniref:ABC transporter substrate-binding protein n=1 Tax=Luteipulveratus halotolerans TaxID=1631356 RepID=A0A0L6CG24_9MICO|nr:ABC transporter substrate-binding protein [Luteipulveratus halotolerans]KNX36535.1 ABC transporter substrate-binding protein [Luteipulveratus halotolerans]
MPVSALLALSLTGCAIGAGTAAEPQKAADGRVTLRYQGSANAVTLPELAEDLGYFKHVRLKWVGNTINGPQDIQSAATGQTDFGGAFSGAVVKLIRAGAPVKAVVNYYGEDAKTFNGFYVKAGSPIRTPRDLIGKKIAVNTLGAHSEAVIDTYLTRNGLTKAEIDKVQLVVLPPNDTEQAIRRGQVDVGSLGGVLQDRAVAAGGLRSLFNDYQLFGSFNGGQYVLRNDFAAKNPEAAQDFVTGVAKAVEWERTTPRAQVIQRFTKIINERKRNESTASLKYWKSVGIPSQGGAVSDADYTRWTDWLDSSGIVPKGELDPKSLYTNEFNGLAKAGGQS